MLGLSLCLVIKVTRLYVDDTSWAVVYEEISCCWTIWQVMEMEKESSPMDVTVQMEVAKAMETVRMD